MKGAITRLDCILKDYHDEKRKVKNYDDLIKADHNLIQALLYLPDKTPTKQIVLALTAVNTRRRHHYPR